MSRPDTSALDWAEKLLNQEPDFHKLTNRYIGIISAHSELWCAQQFKLDLPGTVVAEGADAIATVDSCEPFQAGDRIQIKARDSETMHVSCRITNIDWLVVLAYELSESPVRVYRYCFSVPQLIAMADRFEKLAGSPVIPLRRKGEQHIRLEWSALKVTKLGKVRRATDTWEQRAERAREILAEGYAFEDGIFKKGIRFEP